MKKTIDTNKFYFESIVTFKCGEEIVITTTEVANEEEAIESLIEYVSYAHNDKTIEHIQMNKLYYLNTLN